MKQKIRPDGRKHQIPRTLYGFFSDLELTEGVEEIRGGRFLYRSRIRNFSTHMQFYDETSRVLRIRAQNRGFIAYFDIRIKPEAKQELEDYIMNYHSNGKKEASRS